MPRGVTSRGQNEHSEHQCKKHAQLLQAHAGKMMQKSYEPFAPHQLTRPLTGLLHAAALASMRAKHRT
jgi:hypothetical protein